MTNDDVDGIFKTSAYLPGFGFDAVQRQHCGSSEAFHPGGEVRSSGQPDRVLHGAHQGHPEEEAGMEAQHAAG